MSRTPFYHKGKHKHFAINKFNFVIPLMSIIGIAALSVGFINYNPEDFASASNSAPISTTVSYEDEYITISSSSAINIGTADVVADGDTYVYTTDNVTVSTNVSTGYDLYITSGNTESASLTNPDYYTEIAATSGTGSDTGTPKVLDANSYGYAVPNTLATNSNFDADYSNPTTTSKWAGVPSGASDRIRSTHTANESGDVTDVHYGAYVTNYLAEGTYTGEVVYSAVATPTHETVNMEIIPNTGLAEGGTVLTVISGPTNISTSHELSTSEVEVYFRQNNTIKGACTVTSVDPSAGYLETTCTTPSLVLGSYDVVIVVPRYGFTDTISKAYTVPALNDIKYMQEVTPNICANSTTWASNEAQYTLVDSRDDNSYTIRKLADGNCWMTQNLRLSGYRTLTADDSDVLDSFILPTSSNSGWCATYSTACIDVARMYTQDDYGPYYDWYAATAGSGTYSKTSGNADYSICPKGWKLPVISGNYSLAQLYQLYGYSTANIRTAIGIIGNSYKGGFYYANSLTADSTPYWWTRTAYNDGYAHNVYINDYGLYDDYKYHAKFYGHSVRCVFVGK